MTSQELGSSFEKITEGFFLWLFQKMAFQVNNHWIQKAGQQNGFDVGFEVAILNDSFFKRSIFIECKNYKKSKLERSKLHDKLIQFDESSFLKKDSIFIFLSPHIDLSKCAQDSNPKQLEDYFNKHRDFKTIILTPNNKVREILSLNELIFKKVYSAEEFIICDESYQTEILNYFHKLLSSKGEIPDFSLIAQKENYLKEASKSDAKAFYVKRTLKRNRFSFLNEDKSLLEQLKEDSLILLLGEPGTGKTTELINLSNYFKENISELGITPIFINLSNMGKFELIADILPNGWELNSRVVLLFDAFDEFEFKGILSEQIKKLLENKEVSFKIVISCRTYAYKDELSQLEPAKFYLDGFTAGQSIELLSNKFGLPIEVYNEIDHDKFNDVLEDPFMLNRFGIYYLKHHVIPESVFEIYEDIKNEISDEELEIYKIFALILELTKSTIIEKGELKSLFGLRYKQFIKLKFIQNSFDKKSFKFIHKNYQEYFAALALSELPVAEIIKFIVIDGTTKTHPSLFNTITFLINIIEIQKFQSLLDWFKSNDKELLFKADKTRIENVRVEIFQEYFNSECFEKTFWITNNKTFTVKEIAEFGNCEENFDYLVSIVNDLSNHYRVIISALELLSFFSIPDNKLEGFKKNLLVLLDSKSIPDQVKAHAIGCIDDQMLCRQDVMYLNKIFEIFKSETSKQINVELLSLLTAYEPIDEFYWYVKDEFLRNKGIVPRGEKDNVLRGNSWKLEKLITRFEQSSHFIFFAKFYFDETTNSHSDNRFAEEIIERCLYFEKKEDDFMVRLLSSFEEKEKYYLRETLLKKLFSEVRTSSEISSFKYLIENFAFNNVCYFLASITTEETINIAIDKFKDGSLDSDNLDFYRNVIANHGNRKLAGEFNNIMIANGFAFKQPFLFEEEFEVHRSRAQNKSQENFDILFDKAKLLSEIETIFAAHGNSIKREEMRNIDMAWYDKNGHGNKIDTAYSLLSRLVYKKKAEVTFEDIVSILENEFIMMEEIKFQIRDLTDEKIRISSEQNEFILEWCLKSAEAIDFNNIMERIDDSRFTLGRDYEKLKTVLFFMQKLNLNLPKEFMLNSIEFFDVDKSNIEDMNLNMLKERINDIEAFNRRITENLLHRPLVYFSLNKHVEYALNNNLTETYPKIKECFFIEGLIYNSDAQLAQYFMLTNDIDSLLELCADVESHNCWSSIKILKGLGTHDQLCIEKAIAYLELKLDKEKQYYYSRALGILFELNSLAAITYLEHFMKMKNVPSLQESSFMNYNRIGNYEVLYTLFDKIYLGDRDEIGYSGISNFLKTYISNLSRTKEGFDVVIAKLYDIKKQMQDTENDNGVFYINLLIEDCKDSYVSSKSKALTFDEALEKVEEILN